MALSQDEKQAVLACKYFGGFWGRKDSGLCPAGTVAQMRGVEFSCDIGLTEDVNSIYIYDLRNEEHYKKTQQAIDDVAEWLGLTHKGFLDALDVEHEKILDRIPKDGNANAP